MSMHVWESVTRRTCAVTRRGRYAAVRPLRRRSAGHCISSTTASSVPSRVGRPVLSWVVHMRVVSRVVGRRVRCWDSRHASFLPALVCGGFGQRVEGAWRITRRYSAVTALSLVRACIVLRRGAPLPLCQSATQVCTVTRICVFRVFATTRVARLLARNCAWWLNVRALLRRAGCNCVCRLPAHRCHSCLPAVAPWQSEL